LDEVVASIDYSESTFLFDVSLCRVDQDEKTGHQYPFSLVKKMKKNRAVIAKFSRLNMDSKNVRR